jgi:hypothetical protein
VSYRHEKQRVFTVVGPNAQVAGAKKSIRRKRQTTVHMQTVTRQADSSRKANFESSTASFVSRDDDHSTIVCGNDQMCKARFCDYEIRNVTATELGGRRHCCRLARQFDQMMMQLFTTSDRSSSTIALS